jgi:antibiotic biosynthesis monooxygenase (ABM) superfamily enzyme
MSFRKALWALTVVVCLAAPVAVQAQGDYLDVFVVKVKPEKRADFLALAKKYADANRRFNGDRWLASEAVYGEGNVYQFTSTRKDYAETDQAAEAFMLAANKAFGKEAAQKMNQDFDSCLVWSRSELRRRRWDLSRKAPKDAEAYAKFIGESRLLRTTAVHIHPGHVPDFEALMKEVKETAEKNPDTQPVMVSQVIEGSKGTIFYVSTLRSSMGGFDHNPTTREILGEEGFKKFQQISAEAVEVADSTLFRFNPELSNPPEDVAKVAMDFWRPKGVMAAAAKPKTSLEPVVAKEPTKKP